MALSDAVIGLKAYKEVDQRMELLWHEVDMAIVSPRMDIRTTSLPSIEIRDVSLSRHFSMLPKDLTGGNRMFSKQPGRQTRPSSLYSQTWRRCFPTLPKGYRQTSSSLCLLS